MNPLVRSKGVLWEQTARSYGGTESTRSSVKDGGPGDYFRGTKDFTRKDKQE